MCTGPSNRSSRAALSTRPIYFIRTFLDPLVQSSTCLQNCFVSAKCFLSNPEIVSFFGIVLFVFAFFSNAMSASNKTNCFRRQSSKKTMRKCYLWKASSPLYHMASIVDGVCFQLEKCHNDHSLLICHGRSEVGKTTAINIWRELRLDGLAGPILKYYSHPSQ